MAQVLGIDVDETMLACWRRWWAPPVQPFRVDGVSGADRDAIAAVVGNGCEPAPSDEVRDTFEMYGGDWLWLDEERFAALPPALGRTMVRRSRKLGRRVWWPDQLAAGGDGPVMAYVEDGVRPSRHRNVDDATWQAAGAVVPGARALVGTFPPRSGPNCFGTVMGAAGVTGAAGEWMQREPFDRWLADRTETIQGTAHDGEPGVVLVWRDGVGEACHAAVTVGDGWAVSKPSQAWCSPVVAWTVRQTVLAGRYRGLTLQRHRLLR